MTKTQSDKARRRIVKDVEEGEIHGEKIEMK